MKTKKIFGFAVMLFSIACLVVGVSSAIALPVSNAGGYAALFVEPVNFFANFDYSLIGVYNIAGGASFATISLVSLGQPSDLDFEEGTENMGGFGSIAYLALRSQIATYPTQSTDHSNIENLAKLIGSYIFNTDRRFIQLDCIPTTVGLTAEAQGEYVGSQSYKVKGEFMIAGTGAKVRGYSRLLNNSYGVLILINENGERIALGTEQYPVSFKCTVVEGVKPSDTKALKVEFTSDSFVPGYIYEGEIVLDTETLPAVS